MSELEPNPSINSDQTDQSAPAQTQLSNASASSMPSNAVTTNNASVQSTGGLSEADSRFTVYAEGFGVESVEANPLLFMLSDPRRKLLDTFVPARRSTLIPPTGPDGKAGASFEFGMEIEGETPLLLMAPVRTNSVEHNRHFGGISEPLPRKLYGLGLASAVVIVPNSEAPAVADLWRKTLDPTLQRATVPAEIVECVKQLTTTKNDDGRMTLEEFRSNRGVALGEISP